MPRSLPNGSGIYPNRAASSRGATVGPASLLAIVESPNPIAQLSAEIRKTAAREDSTVAAPMAELLGEGSLGRRDRQRYNRVRTHFTTPLEYRDPLA